MIMSMKMMVIHSCTGTHPFLNISKTLNRSIVRGFDCKRSLITSKSVNSSRACDYSRGVSVGNSCRGLSWEFSRAGDGSGDMLTFTSYNFGVSCVGHDTAGSSSWVMCLPLRYATHHGKHILKYEHCITLISFQNITIAAVQKKNGRKNTNNCQFISHSFFNLLAIE